MVGKSVEIKSKKDAKQIHLPWFKQYKWTAIAAIILALAGLVSIYFISELGKPNQTVASINNDKNPASQTAQLILADGTILNLDSNFSGNAPKQGNVSLSVKEGGITYSGNDKSTMLNTINIPKGGNYFITLSDNTKVWLNAASSLQYPVAFSENERNVKLIGEAYFEVAKNGKPFNVTVSDKGAIKVIGTHFNINTYNNDIRTTLLEGSVLVTPTVDGKLIKENAKMLRPGQQAIIDNNKLTINRDVDIDEIMAWRNNMFYFDNETLENILKEISRWYDVELVFKTSKNIKSKRYFMMIDRSKQLSEVLKSIQIDNVKFVISGNKLIIE